MRTRKEADRPRRKRSLIGDFTNGRVGLDGSKIRSSLMLWIKRQGLIWQSESDFIHVRIYVVYLKLISESGIFLTPGASHKAPYVTIMVLSIYGRLRNFAVKPDQEIKVITAQDGCNRVMLPFSLILHQ
jgi:hypothetical protein